MCSNLEKQPIKEYIIIIKWLLHQFSSAQHVIFRGAWNMPSTPIPQKFPQHCLWNHCWSSWWREFLIVSRKTAECFLFLPLSPPGNRWCDILGLWMTWFPNAGATMQELQCRSDNAGATMQERQCRSYNAGATMQELQCRSYNAGATKHWPLYILISTVT